MPQETTIAAVLAVLGERGKMSAAEIADASGLDAASVDAALQSLLLRHQVVCGSYKPAGRGGQAARFIGEAMEPVWSVVHEDSPGGGVRGACFDQRPRGKRTRGATQITGDITFVAPPAGEVPEDVRRAWVGVTVLVTARESRLLRSVAVSGVLTGRVGHLHGYAIESRECIEHLRAQDPAAAAWCTDNFPGLMARGRTLSFSEESCDLRSRSQ